MIEVIGFSKKLPCRREQRLCYDLLDYSLFTAKRKAFKMATPIRTKFRSQSLPPSIYLALFSWMHKKQIILKITCVCYDQSKYPQIHFSFYNESSLCFPMHVFSLSLNMRAFMLIQEKTSSARSKQN